MYADRNVHMEIDHLIVQHQAVGRDANGRI